MYSYWVGYMLFCHIRFVIGPFCTHARTICDETLSIAHSRDVVALVDVLCCWLRDVVVKPGFSADLPDLHLRLFLVRIYPLR